MSSGSSSSAAILEQPTRDYGVESALCHLGMRFLIMTGYFRDHLTTHFATASHIEEPDLRHLLWRPGETSNILIESKHRWRPELTQKRPAILIARNACKFIDRGIGLNRAGETEQGNPRYAVTVVGSHTLFCMHHKQGAGVEILATEVSNELLQFAPVIGRTLNLLRYRVVEVGAIARVEEATANYVVPITVAWAYETKWILEQEARPLTRIAMNFALNS